MARSKKERKANLKGEKEKSHRVILNALIIINRDIISEIAIRN
jgi:hypothetical protein